MSASDYEFIYIVLGGDTTAVTPCGNNGITVTCPTGTATLNKPYASTIVATGGTAPYIYSITAGTLPGGLTLNKTTGDVTGTPTLLGTFNYTVQAQDANGAIGTNFCTIIVSGSSGRITASCPTSTVISGRAYSGTIRASGGTSPYTFSITSGTLPTGLTLSGSTGVVSGTTTDVGLHTVVIHIVDSSSPTPLTADITCAFRVVTSQTIGGPGEAVQWRLHRFDAEIRHEERA